MCNQPPATNHEFPDPSERQGMTTGQASDEPVSAPKSPVRTFGQLPDMHLPEDFDEPLPDAEIAFWEADSID